MKLSLYNMDVLQALHKIDNESVDHIVTSPPYWGLRDYGTSTATLWDAKKGCQHEWKQGKVDLQHENRNNRRGTQEEVAANPTGTTYIRKLRTVVGNQLNEAQPSQISAGSFCSLCGAWNGQLGLEPDYHDYLKHFCKLILRRCNALERAALGQLEFKMEMQAVPSVEVQHP